MIGNGAVLRLSRGYSRLIVNLTLASFARRGTTEIAGSDNSCVHSPPVTRSPVGSRDSLEYDLADLTFITGNVDDLDVVMRHATAEDVLESHWRSLDEYQHSRSYFRLTSLR